MISVNIKVINSFPTFSFPGKVFSVVPTYASPSIISKAEQSPLTNRIPDHEPWPRVLMGDTANINSPNDEYNRNTRHNPQYNNDGTYEGSYPIGRMEGDQDVHRGPLWRR